MGGMYVHLLILSLPMRMTSDPTDTEIAEYFMSCAAEPWVQATNSPYIGCDVAAMVQNGS
ncbi:hypothetical protein QCA50_013718 [Cerrena zonata]|uniref:Uncharacterized protein n=1 Tax=Cerrena zonata TaxID=2478898 RepID=A0AAW0FQK6_9APHY